MRAWGVFVDGPPLSVNEYSVLLVGTDGKVAASAHAIQPEVYHVVTPPPAPPLVSITNTRVYYADATSIKFLKPDGSTGVAMSYPGANQTVVGFAVSPDDRRVAVAVLVFQTPSKPQALDIYVEDLGGGNRVALFTSATVTEWPVAWTAGHIVIAVGPLTVGGNSRNPYHGSSGYHVADATTGKRLVTMSDDCLYGPLVSAGTACVLGAGQIYGQTFDGSIQTVYPSNQYGPQDHLALAPDGARAAGQNSSANLVLFGRAQTGPLSTVGVPLGWIDDLHLVFAKPNSSSRSILDLAGSAPSETPMPACTCPDAGIFFGSIPVAP